MAGLFGSGPDQLSIGDILAGLQPVGQVLAARGKKIGLPLGLGLTAVGGLSDAYMQRQRAQQQRQGLADALTKLQGGAKLADVMPGATAAGVSPADVFNAYSAMNPVAKPSPFSEAVDFFKKDPQGFSQFEEAFHPKPSKQDKRQLVNNPGVAPYMFDPDTGSVTPVAGAPTRPFAPERPERGSYTALLNPDGTISGFYNPVTGDFKPPPVTGARKTAPHAATGHEADVQDWLKRNPGKTREDAEVALKKDISAAGRGPTRYTYKVVGDRLLALDPTNPTGVPVEVSRIPEKVKNPNEYENFAAGYAAKHPDAKGDDIATAYEKMKSGGKEKKTTASRGTVTWKGYKYTTVKNPDGSMTATLADNEPMLVGRTRPKRLFFPPGSATPVELPEGAEVVGP